jgi:Cu2+-containing amine oxidase
MTGKVLLLGFFAFSLTSVAAQTRSPQHPLDALTADEYWPVHDALEESGRFADKTIVSSLLSYHLELDVDAPNNRFMIDRLVPQQISGCSRKSIWVAESSMAKTEKDAILDIDPRRPSMWHFINPTQHGDVGYPTGYEIMPGATAVSNMPLEDPAQKAGGFSEHQMWVTPNNPDELYAAGSLCHQ